MGELGDLARRQEAAEKARLDERWDRLAAGTLTDEEDEELRALAATSAEAREAYDAFRPLGPDFQARVADAIAAELKRPPILLFRPAIKFGGWVSAAAAAAERPEPRPRVLPFRPAVRIGGWVSAAAAAVLVIFLRPTAPLPDYQQITVSGGSSEMRGEPTEEPVPAFAPGDRIQVGLRPATSSRAGRLEAQLFLLQDGKLRRLETQNEIDPGGAVRMQGAIARDLQPGTWTLWAVVGRPGDLPDPAELQSLAARNEIRRRDWTAVPKDIRIRPRGP